MPLLNGTFRFHIDGNTEDTTVTTRARLVNYAVHKKAGKRIRNLSPSLKTGRQKLTVKSTTTTAFTVNASAIRNLNRRVIERHGSLYRIANFRTSVAIDSERRVIEDMETGIYVVRDHVWYQFTPEWAENQLPPP